MSEPAREGGRLLLVTRNFPPLRGGMERLNQRMLEGLSRHYHVALAGPAGCGRFVPPGTPVVETSVRSLAGFLLFGALRAARLARRLRPRMILAGSGLAVPLAWCASRLCRARVAAYLHGLDIVSANPVYRAIWRPWLTRCDVVFANSHNTARLAQDAGVPAARIRVVHPGVDAVAVDASAARGFRDAHGLGDAMLLLALGRLTPRKGLAEFVREVLPRVVAHAPDAKLLLMGHDPSQALQRSGHSESERIHNAVRDSGLGDHVVWIPPCDDRDLAAVYQASDVHVFPVRATAGDVEGFGMVAVEAAANGVPTVAFAVDGVPDAIVADVTGRLVPPGDAGGFAAAVVEMAAARRDPAWSARCRETSQRYDWSRFHREIIAALDTLPGGEGR